MTRNIVSLIVVFVLSAGLALAQAHKPLNIVNSEKDEMDPHFCPAGDMLYFSRAFSPSNAGGKRDGGDIWVSARLSNAEFSEAAPLNGRLNNGKKNQIVGFNTKGDIMYLLNAYEETLSDKAFAYSKKKGNGSWTAPKPLGLVSFRAKGDYGASVTADGKVMVLYGESYGTRGAEDLYVSFRKNDLSWSDPIHLGDQINTAYQEVTPYLASDHKTLYFSSNGHRGEGSFDVFVAHRLDDTWKNWSKPTNLGKTVNTKGSEKYYQVGPEGVLALYTSTLDSEGYSDIKFIWSENERFSAPEKKLTEQKETVADDAVEEKAVPAEELKEAIKRLALSAADAGTKESLPFEYKPAESGQWETAESGKAMVAFDGDSLKYEIRAAGYLPVSFMMRADNSPHVVFLEKLEIEKAIVLKEVLFERGTVKLLEASHDQLKKLVSVLKQNPSMRIEIGGHTDNRGSAKAKNRLSRNRAAAVKEYLGKSGIDESRVLTRGYGSSRPIASNQSEETRRLNRRVEFKILKR
ncbi:MAG: OmpA family protein [Cytophagales bacterium]|nr:OmpA family protein [Cytophagales bacterium]